jgi:flagellar biosynthesis anti-sigma factor FlgM
MTDAISNQPRIPTANTSLTSTISSTNSAPALASGSSTQAPAVANVAYSGSDTLSLSNVSQQVAEQSGFDQNKVNSIKQALQNGNYAIDPRRIAQGFTALEKLIKE